METRLLFDVAWECRLPYFAQLVECPPCHCRPVLDVFLSVLLTQEPRHLKSTTFSKTVSSMFHSTWCPWTNVWTFTSVCTYKTTLSCSRRQHGSPVGRRTQRHLCPLFLLRMPQDTANKSRWRRPLWRRIVHYRGHNEDKSWGYLVHESNTVCFQTVRICRCSNIDILSMTIYVIGGKLRDYLYWSIQLNDQV